MATRQKKTARRAKRRGRLDLLLAADASLMLYTEASEVSIAAAAADGTPTIPKFECVAYNGGIIRPRLTAPYYGDVIIDLAGVTVEAGGKDLPTLYAHDQTDPIGHCEGVSIDAAIKASGLLSVPGPSNTKVTSAAANGFKWRISVGMAITEIERIEANQQTNVNGKVFRGPLYVVRKGILQEISFLAIGANGRNATAKITASSPTLELVTVNEELKAWLIATANLSLEAIAALTSEQITSLQAAFNATKAPATNPANPGTQPITGGNTNQGTQTPIIDLQASREAQAAERNRVLRIEAIGRQYNNPQISLQAGAAAVDLVAHAIREGWDANQTELEAMRASRPQAPAAHTTSHNARASLEAVTAGLLLRCGVALDHRFFASQAAREAGLPAWLTAGINDENRQRAMNNGHEFRSLSFVELAAEAVRISGREAPRNRRDMLEAAFSSAALTVIFGTSMSARALTTFSEIPDTTLGWTERTTVGDFEQHDRVRLESMESLDHLPPGDEANHAKRSAKNETVQAARYAKQFMIDEQDMLGDRLSLLQTTPVEMGRAAGRLIPDLVYYMMLANPSLTQTGRAMWNSTDGTTSATGALARSTLSALIALLMKMTEGDATLNFMPTHLVVGAELLDTAVQLCGSAVLSNDSGAGNVNPIARYGISPVGDARISNGVRHPMTKALAAGSTSNYYLFDRANTPVEVQTVEGTGGVPRVRVTNLTQGKYGMHVDVSFDVGAKFVKPKGAIRGTAA